VLRKFPTCKGHDIQPVRRQLDGLRVIENLVDGVAVVHDLGYGKLGRPAWLSIAPLGHRLRGGAGHLYYFTPTLAAASGSIAFSALVAAFLAS